MSHEGKVSSRLPTPPLAYGALPAVRVALVAGAVTSRRATRLFRPGRGGVRGRLCSASSSCRTGAAAMRPGMTEASWHPLFGRGPGTPFEWQDLEGEWQSSSQLDTVLRLPAKSGVLGLGVLAFCVAKYRSLHACSGSPRPSDCASVAARRISRDRSSLRRSRFAVRGQGP
jgi:hypothetical protein